MRAQTVRAVDPFNCGHLKETRIGERGKKKQVLCMATINDDILKLTL
jgi:hypothetical protein